MTIKLTDEQRKVVKHRGGPLRVVAGPGTGKTSCLAARIRELILVDRVEPRRILAVTFTRAAAGETRQKLKRQGVPDDRMSDIRTLHSKAVGLLRRHAALLDLPPNVRPLGDQEANLVLKDVAADLTSRGFYISFKGPGSMRDYLRAYRSEQSGTGISSSISSDRRLLKTYHQFSQTYEELQRFYKGIDWFRTVHLALQLLDSHGDVLSQEQDALDHLLVDEYQDLNRGDQALIHRLAGDASGLCIVGDEDQSIYESQRFASPKGLVNFHKFVRGTRTLALTYCHRCPQQVLDKANLLIQNNRNRIPDKPPLRSLDATKRGVVATVWHRSKKAEVEWVVKKVSELHKRGFEYRDILILFAEGQIGQDYISALQQANVPLAVQLKVTGPFDSLCFARVLATLRFLSDQGDNLALRQCLDYWPNIGNKTIREVRQLAVRQQESLWQAICRIASQPEAYGSIARRRSVRDFHAAMTKLLAIHTFAGVFRGILQILSDCKVDAGVGLLREHFAGYSGKEAAVNLGDVLGSFEQEREAGRFETAEELPDKVRVMTMHSAKGLEANVVIIPALEDDLMPGQMGNLEERRRLFYVSITRAKKILLLSWASQRVGQETHRRGGKMLGKERSRFLREMGE